MKRENKGTSFDSWLDEEGIGEEVTAAVLKRVLARQIAAAMRRRRYEDGDGAADARQPRHPRPPSGR